jgi:hypothetical protein
MVIKMVLEGCDDTTLLVQFIRDGNFWGPYIPMGTYPRY